MAFKHLIKVSIGLSIVLGSMVGLANPTFATQSQMVTEGGDSSSSSKGGICPPGSLHYGDTSITNIGQCNLPKENADDALMKRVQIILNVIIGVIGIVTVAVIVLGGVSYVTSQGEAAKLAKAKNTILYGIVGLVVAMLAFAIVNFVLNSIF